PAKLSDRPSIRAWAVRCCAAFCSEFAWGWTMCHLWRGLAAGLGAASVIGGSFSLADREDVARGESQAGVHDVEEEGGDEHHDQHHHRGHPRLLARRPDDLAALGANLAEELRN